MPADPARDARGSRSGAHGALSSPRQATALALLGAVLWVLMAAPVPVLDEESYLDMVAQASPLRPYDWWRAWQPWGSGREGDAYVFAHPPGHLWWVELLTALVPTAAGTRVLKLAAALPWALLLGGSVAALASQLTRRPGLAVLGWLGAPVVALGLQRGLMPDLALAACTTAAVVGWRRALDGDRRAAVLGGVALAVGAWTKYPALVLVPALLLHLWRVGRSRPEAWRRSAPFWLAAALPLLVGEAWLWATYGRPHLWEVLTRAGEISRGDPGGRFLGLLARAFVLGLPGVALVAGMRGRLGAGLGLGVLGLAVAWGPADLDPAVAVRVLPWAVVGGVVLALVAPGPGRRQDDDGLLLSLWALAVVVGVLVGHNYAAPRYLLPAAAPVALLACRAVDARPGARNLLGATAALGIVLGGALTLAEHRFFEAGDALAARVSAAWPTPGVSTGEWSFRHRLRTEGWARLAPDTPSGTLLVAPVNASPGPVPAGATPEGTASYGSFPLRVVSAEDRVGLYAETLGAVPLGWGEGPLETATTWRVP